MCEPEGRGSWQDRTTFRARSALMRLPDFLRSRSGDGAWADLPPIVRDRIAREQDKSERLISWIQLAIVGAFGLLYFSSRITAPMATHIWLLTPLAIGLYFAATVIRLFMSYRI